MASDNAQRRPVSSATNCWFVAVILLFTIQAIPSQRVKVEEEKMAYPTESVNLRCQFVDGGGRTTKLTQVSWVWEPVEGQRDNIAVFHPMYGQNFPNRDFEGRVAFINGTLENPSIRISNLRMADAGRYTCEYATYPLGNEQGTTNLIMLAKARNSASAVTVLAGTKPAVVAWCEAAEGKPAATIEWLASVGGRHGDSSTAGADGTVTVRSEYRLVPTPADDGREVSCMVTQQTLSERWVFPVRLSVQYPPTVTIEGYDANWYVGRSDAALICTANANPTPAVITWTTTSGRLPDTVFVDGNKLKVRKVDAEVNATFICEVKNKVGVGKQQVTTNVIENKRTESPSTGAVIGGILGALAVIGIIIGVVFFIRKRQAEGEGPPKHKPPPPVRLSSSTEMLNKPRSMETAPLGAGEVYYETGGGEPVTNLDEDSSNTGRGTLNGGAPLVREDSAMFDNGNELKEHRNDVESANHEAPAANIARGESFVSAAMYV